MSHKHNYIAVRTVTKNGRTYVFLECANSGCPNPNKMEIK